MPDPSRPVPPPRPAARVAAAVILLGLTAVAVGAPPTDSASETRSIRGLIEKGDLEAADRRAQDLIAALERQGKGETTETADALDLLLGILDLRRVGAARGVPLARRAADLRRRLGPETEATARSIENLARWMHRMGEERESRALSEEALAIRERILDPGDLAIAGSLNSLGSSFGATGDWVAARAYFERSLAIYERSGGFQSREARVVLYNLGTLLENMGDYAAVRELYEHYLDDMERRADPSLLGRVRAWSWICQMDHRLGDDARARASYRKARGFWERAHEQRGALEGLHPMEFANTATRLATAARAVGKVEDARRFYLIGVEDRERSLGKDHPEVTWDLRRLAETLHEAGDSAQARPYIDRACRIQPIGTPGDHAARSFCLALRSAIMRKMGEAWSARDVIRSARSLGETALGSDNPDLLPVIVEQARVSFATGDLDGARRHALKAEAVARRHFRRTAAWLSHGEALRFEEARVSGLDIALSSLTAMPGPPSVSAVEETWDAVVRSRGLVLDEQIARRRIVASAKAEGIEDVVVRLEEDRSRLAHVVARGPAEDSEEDFVETVRSLIRRQEGTERELAARSAPFRRHLDRQEIGWDRLRDALPRDAALVAYVRYTRSRGAGAILTESPSYLAFVRSGWGGKPQVVPLGNAEPIDALVDGWRERVAGSPRKGLGFGVAREAGDAAAAGDRLRRAIWDPIEKRLGGEKMVLVIPDGALHRINLAALPAADGRFMVESDRVIHHISSERDLAGSGVHSRGEGLLALGAPDFDGGAVELAGHPGPSLHRGGPFPGLGSRSFPPLPAARMEVEEIANRWREAGGGPGGEPVVLVGRDATEAALKRLAGGRRVIHLATHGFFDAGGEPLRETGQRIGASEANPLLATGLALAGANGRGGGASSAVAEDDGILLGEEVLSLDLTGVEWVVLSACGTGLGPVQAREGVHGLRRSFQGAGASTVIMTLWEVEDESTRAWMKALYRGRLEGLSTADSVRQASLELIAEARRKGRQPHPYHWGGFVAAGDWR